MSSVTKPIIYLFAKKPVQGEVKTRLLDEFNTREATDIAVGLLRATVDRVYAAWPGRVVISVWPDDNHPEFIRIKQKYDIAFTSQAPGDLGRKMYAALNKGIVDYGAAAVLGCDIPHIDVAVLAHSFHCLSNGRNVIGPAADGGFYLLGLTQTHPKMFKDIDWGTESVLQGTLKQFKQCGIAIPEMLATMRDIDTAADVRWTMQTYDWLRDYLPPSV